MIDVNAEPIRLMKSNEFLKESNFSIWKYTQSYQNIHNHDYYQIWYVLKGECKHKIDNHNFTLSEGELIVIPPFSYHSMSQGSSDLLVIGIDFNEKIFSSVYKDNDIFISCINPLFSGTKEKMSIETSFEKLILEMFEEYTNKTTFYEIVIRSNLLKLIVALERMNISPESTKTENHAIAEALKYIHNNINTKIKIEDLCKISNLSPTSLGVYFKKITGKTVVEYINKIKIDKSKQLLKETDFSITDISYELGFSDSAYFNRVFKKMTSLSPKGYRNKHKKPLQ